MKNAITETIQTYVRSYLNADAEGLSGAFHSGTRLHSASKEGALEQTEMADWLSHLRQRKTSGDIRQGSFDIAFIDVTGDTAMAKVILQLPTMRFTDYLSLLKLEGRWVITGKIYSMN